MGKWQLTKHGGGPVTTPDWAGFHVRAASALRRRLVAVGELSPRAVAETVAAALPEQWGQSLMHRLSELGWLTPDATIPFDVLDGPACPADFRGAGRELARLAVFGLPGQGLSSRDKRRQDVYQQLCAEIMSGAVDTTSLQSVAARALSHPDVVADGTLNSMLRSFIAEREAALRAERITPDEEHREHERRSKLRRAFDRPRRCDYPSKEELLASYARLHRDFDRYLAQFEENRALTVLDRMRDLRRRFPVHIPTTEFQRCEEQYDRLLKRAGQYRRQIQELASKGAAAAQVGDETKAAWVIRRLHAIHTLLPTLLSSERFEQLQQQISRCTEERETRQAARELRARQVEVAEKIKDLAGAIHRFHELAQRLSPEDQAYQRAELNYRRAVEEIRVLDTDWLTGLVLQLETLLEELDDPTGQMQNQLDKFIGSVRTALNRLCLEIRARQARKAPRKRTRPPRKGDAPARPA